MGHSLLRPFRSPFAAAVILSNALVPVHSRIALGDPLFAAPCMVYPPQQSIRIVAADVNSDGRLDLVSTLLSSKIVVLVATGNGSFAAPQSYPAGGSPHGLAVADLNGDGKPDVVTANSVGSVSVLLGNGDGTFGPKTDFTTGAGAEAVAVGDLNGDGKPDLAVADQGNALTVLMGNGDGTFGGRTDYPVPDPGRSVAIADLNGDGRRDVVMTSSQTSVSSGNVSVFLGNGDGTLAARTDYADVARPTWVAIGDLNGDGTPDLAVANRAGTASVFLGNGNATFGPKTDYPVGAGPNSQVVIADVDGDGRRDLVVTYPFYSVFINYYAGVVNVLRGNGDGTFGPKSIVFGGDPLGIAVADLNGDGKLDLATAGPTGNVFVAFGNGNATFGFNRLYGAPRDGLFIAAGDLNGDGNPDAVISGYGATAGVPALNVWLGNADGTFGPRADYAPGGGSAYPSVAIGDLNGDGKPDVVVPDYDNDSVKVVPGNGDGTFEPRIAYASGVNPNSVAVGDLNGDGRKDLVVANVGSNAVSVYLQQPNGSLGPRNDIAMAAGAATYWVDLGDLNGDGKLDLAVANPGTNTVSILLGHGDGTFGPETDVTTNSPLSVVIADVNGDGKPDLLTVNNGGPTAISVRLGVGDGTFGSTIDSPVDFYSTVLAVGDLNGDGRLDVVASGYYVCVLVGNGDGTFTPESDYGLASYAATIADLDHDGRPEILAPLYGLNVLWNTGGQPWVGVPLAPSRLPVALAMNSPRPNPSGGSVELRFQLPVVGRVALDLFDVNGRRIRVLESSRELAAGERSISWDGRDQDGRAVAPGIYLARLNAGGRSVWTKVVRCR